jgi:3'-phosphoadenosine 5'-phosphosulfate sulfotransferase (PAPS reductase)/FAD synthetase
MPIATRPMVQPSLDHLRVLEAESIHIFREVVAEFERPVMLYSIGKDSSVLLRLAQKAFYPAPIPFPLLHIDTTYKFKEMIEFRDSYTREIGARLIVHTNEEAISVYWFSLLWPMISCAVKLMPQVGKALPTKKLSDWSGK